MRGFKSQLSFTSARGAAASPDSDSHLSWKQRGPHSTKYPERHATGNELHILVLRTPASQTALLGCEQSSIQLGLRCGLENKVTEGSQRNCKETGTEKGGQTFGVLMDAWLPCPRRAGSLSRSSKLHWLALWKVKPRGPPCWRGLQQLTNCATRHQCADFIETTSSLSILHIETPLSVSHDTRMLYL
jgi:hypothetical protein